MYKFIVTMKAASGGFLGELSFVDIVNGGPATFEFSVNDSRRDYVIDSLVDYFLSPGSPFNLLSYADMKYRYTNSGQYMRNNMQHISYQMQQYMLAVEMQAAAGSADFSIEFEANPSTDTLTHFATIFIKPVTPVPYITFPSVLAGDEDGGPSEQQLDKDPDLLDLVTM